MIKHLVIILLLVFHFFATASDSPAIGLISDLGKDDKARLGLSLILAGKLLQLDIEPSEKNLTNCNGLIILIKNGNIPQKVLQLASTFAAKGNNVFMDMESFAKMNSTESMDLNIRNMPVILQKESPATKGFKRNETFPVISENGKMHVLTVTEAIKNKIEILVMAGNSHVLLARKKEGNGCIYAFDILSIGEPCIDDKGSFYKYLPVSNIFGNPVKYGEYYSSKMSYDEIIGKMKKMSLTYPELTLKEEGNASGNFKIYSLNIGNPNAPMFFTYAAVHGSEWEPAYGLLTFARKLAGGEFKNLIDLDKICFKIIPVMNPYGYEKRTRRNANMVDLNRQGDCEWDTCWVDRNHDGKYDQNDESWKGQAGPFSEPEAITYKTIIDNSANIYFVLDFHGNIGTKDNFLCLYYSSAKEDNPKRAASWSKRINELLKGRYILKQAGDENSIPYHLKAQFMPNKLTPTLTRYATTNKYGFVLELTANYKTPIASVLVTDIVAESILSILEFYPPQKI